MRHDNKDIENILKPTLDYRLDKICEILQCWNFYMRNLHHNTYKHYDKSSHSIFTLLDIEESTAFLAKYSVVFNMNGNTTTIHTDSYRFVYGLFFFFKIAYLCHLSFHTTIKNDS